MSYRALVTIQSLNEAGEVADQCFAVMGLDEDFRNGEQVAHLIADQRVYPQAADFAENSGFNFGLHYRGVHWDATDYRETYADQEWVISFQRKDDCVRVVILGKDSGPEEIFKRVTVYYVG